MDLPELLEPERIRCRCDIQSKKRALQTLAELLGPAVRPEPAGEATTDKSDAPEADANGKSARLKNGLETARRAGKRRSKKKDPAPELSDMDVLDALIGRERLGSTGLGHGVALPHSRVETINAPLAAMITLDGGVDFEAADGVPVDLIVGLLVPQDCNDDHLKILANLARRFSDASFRENLRAHADPTTLYAELLQSFDPS